MSSNSFRPGLLTISYYFLAIPAAILVEVIFYRIAISHKNWIEPLMWFLMINFFFFTFFILIDGIGNRCRRIEQKSAQKKRDKKARELFEQIIAFKPESSFSEEFKQDYYLYLRPFYSTGKVRIRLQFQEAQNKSVTYLVYGQRRLDIVLGDLETELSSMLSSKAPMLALGKPGEQIGAGRIQSKEDDWQSDFSRLAEGARVIFVVPSTHPGTLWEINQLFSDERLIRKCIFIIPPIESLIEKSEFYGYEFNLGSIRDFKAVGSLHKDAVQALKEVKINGHGTAAFQAKELGSLLLFAASGKILKNKELLTYEKEWPSFYSLFWFCRSLRWGSVERLSFKNLFQTISAIERYITRTTTWSKKSHDH